ncbi:hypothetical protein ACSFBL_35095, partial [Variovorax sp. GT1P44]
MIEPAGAFTIKMLRSLHSSPATAMGSILAPLEVPARASAFKEGGSYSFLITHRLGVVLVHPSADFAPDMMNSVRADVVFLGIGGLSKRGEAFTRAYWKELVDKTHAKTVIPVHWDDFATPLSEPMRPLPQAYGDFDQTMSLLVSLAHESRVRLALMPVARPVPILPNRD